MIYYMLRCCWAVVFGEKVCVHFGKAPAKHVGTPKSAFSRKSLRASSGGAVVVLA
jgi:hypothetical protein